MSPLRPLVESMAEALCEAEEELEALAGANAVLEEALARKERRRVAQVVYAIGVGVALGAALAGERKL
jgi:hypothetical protein